MSQVTNFITSLLKKPDPSSLKTHKQIDSRYKHKRVLYVQSIARLANAVYKADAATWYDHTWNVFSGIILSATDYKRGHREYKSSLHHLRSAQGFAAFNAVIVDGVDEDLCPVMKKKVVLSRRNTTALCGDDTAPSNPSTPSHPQVPFPSEVFRDSGRRLRRSARWLRWEKSLRVVLEREMRIAINGIGSDDSMLVQPGGEGSLESVLSEVRSRAISNSPGQTSVESDIGTDCSITAEVGISMRAPDDASTGGPKDVSLRDQFFQHSDASGPSAQAIDLSTTTQQHPSSSFKVRSTTSGPPVGASFSERVASARMNQVDHTRKDSSRQRQKVRGPIDLQVSSEHSSEPVSNTFHESVASDDVGSSTLGPVPCETWL